jgi:mannose/cellobiose epimerase-like protein (N-acyl-D-glucosamine 2-epimerase family)
MTPATFAWDDLGSWEAMFDAAPKDKHGNALAGDVMAIGCQGTYLRSEGRLISAVGLKDMVVIATNDAVLVAPLVASQEVRKIVRNLDELGRPESRITQSPTGIAQPGFWRKRVEHWLFHETLPLWSSVGVDHLHGGFHEALSLRGEPLVRPKRMRTMARQTYAFAVMKLRGWKGDADALIDYGLQFMKRGRTASDGWARTLSVDGRILDSAEDSYDTAFVLLALAHAARAGHAEARQLGEETFSFLRANLADPQGGGYLETTAGNCGLRRSNPHMHLLEAFLAWHLVTGDERFLQEASEIVHLCQKRFFDIETWTLGEFFDETWRLAPGQRRQWTEPGHHFEWAWLLVEFARAASRPDVLDIARKLYVSALGIGINRATSLAYGAVSKIGAPLDRNSRAWPQTELIKAAIALDAVGGLDLSCEIEPRVANLFRWHIDNAQPGLWIDRIDDKGRAIAEDVPASIFYHMICGLTEYLDATASPG